jgi:NAD-dependent deacetylase
MTRDVNDFGERLLRGLSGRVLVITGSGISADSGIPTFRSEDGYWRTYRAEELATPAAFSRQPEVVWSWYRERRAIISAAQPNAAHVALVALAQQCQEFLLITQNVDDLHERATVAGHSLPASEILHVHGEIFVTRCPKCGLSVRERDSPAIEAAPRCPACKALMRPGVVWFGEQLDPQAGDRVQDFLGKATCDVALVIGTTAAFDYIRHWAVAARGRNGWLVEINPHETILSRSADQVLRGRAAEVLPDLVATAFGAKLTCQHSPR